MRKAVVIGRVLLSIALLVVVFRNAHWSVSLALSFVYIRAELEDRS
jgi:hypothetical protein